MQANKSAVERAFDLAKSGKFKNVDAVKSSLSREGYSTAQIEGPILLRQLREAIKAAPTDDSDRK